MRFGVRGGEEDQVWCARRGRGPGLVCEEGKRGGRGPGLVCEEGKRIGFGVRGGEEDEGGRGPGAALEVLRGAKGTLILPSSSELKHKWGGQGSKADALRHLQAARGRAASDGGMSDVLQCQTAGGGEGEATRPAKCTLG
eukprot:364381-Chlamydomonas_euryale.AAC.2